MPEGSSLALVPTNGNGKPGANKFNADERLAVQNEVIRRIAVEGQTVRFACQQLHIDPSLPAQWGLTDAVWAQRYARAREEQSHRFAELAITAAQGDDDFSHAVQKVIEMEEAELIASGVKQWRKIINALQMAAIQRDRLRADTYKWYASKVAPKLYGDRLEVAGDKDAPIRVVYETRVARRSEPDAD